MPAGQVCIMAVAAPLQPQPKGVPTMATATKTKGSTKGSTTTKGSVPTVLAKQGSVPGSLYALAQLVAQLPNLHTVYGSAAAMYAAACPAGYAPKLGTSARHCLRTNGLAVGRGKRHPATAASWLGAYNAHCPNRPVVPAGTTPQALAKALAQAQAAAAAARAAQD